MEAKSFYLYDFHNSSHEFERTSSKTVLSDVFGEKTSSYLNEFNLFLAYFNTIPNFVNQANINCKKATEWFIENYTLEIKNFYYYKTQFNNKKINEYDDIFFILFEDLIVNFDMNHFSVRFLFKKTCNKKINELINSISEFRQKKEKRKPELSLLISTTKGLNIKSVPISKPKLRIEDNYNDDFKDIHDTIIKRLSKKNDKGLVLLHGKPGTGKTSYIRSLISSVKKNVIFLPPNMAGAIANPDLISILVANPNSILVIEDAEKIVVDRDKDGHSPVSTFRAWGQKTDHKLLKNYCETPNTAKSLHRQEVGV